MTNDFPTKAEAKGGRHKKRNPWANKLRDLRYRQQVVAGKKKKNVGGKGDRSHRNYSLDDDDVGGD